jgi:hypothetical protein
MDSDLTFNSVVFAKSFDNEAKSLRQSTARGINIPDQMTVASQPYVDSVTKVAGTRFTIRFDRHDLEAVTSEKYISSAYLVIAVPELENSTDLAVLIATFKAAVADADLIGDVLNGER